MGGGAAVVPRNTEARKMCQFRNMTPKMSPTRRKTDRFSGEMNLFPGGKTLFLGEMNLFLAKKKVHLAEKNLHFAEKNLQKTEKHGTICPKNAQKQGKKAQNRPKTVKMAHRQRTGWGMGNGPACQPRREYPMDDFFEICDFLGQGIGWIKTLFYFRPNQSHPRLAPTMHLPPFE